VVEGKNMKPHLDFNQNLNPCSVLIMGKSRNIFVAGVAQLANWFASVALCSNYTSVIQIHVEIYLWTTVKSDAHRCVMLFGVSAFQTSFHKKLFF